MFAYLERWMALGLPPYRIVRHLLNLFAYQRAARLWKRCLSARTWVPATAVAALREAMNLVPDEVLDAHPQASEALCSRKTYSNLSPSWVTSASSSAFQNLLDDVRVNTKIAGL